MEVATSERVVKEFFTAYAQHDATAMCRLLDPEVVFSDRAFPRATGDKVRWMWRWFCEAFETRREPVRVPRFEVVGVDGDSVDVRYQVQYELFRDATAAQTPGAQPERRVDYVIASSLVVRDGLIVTQTDKPALSSLRFAWMLKGALGVVGTLAGKFDRGLNETAEARLRQFRLHKGDKNL